MQLGDIVTTANLIADEDYSSSQVVQFVNDAIAKINILCSANFPFMSATDSNDYYALPEKWQRALFVPFVVGRMKTVDGSQFEYTDSYSEFNNALELFKVKYQIPDQYVDTDDKKRFDDDFSYNPWLWTTASTYGPLDGTTLSVDTSSSKVTTQSYSRAIPSTDDSDMDGGTF